MISIPPLESQILATQSELNNQTARADFGNVAGEFKALLKKCGVYNLEGRAKISLTGPDRTRWLNGVVTNNVRDLPAGYGVYAFLLSPQGRILGDLYAYNRGESLLVETDRSQLQKVVALFDRYIVMDEVEFSDITDKLSSTGIAGPSSRGVLRSVGLDFPQLQPLQTTNVTWKTLSLCVVRDDGPSLEAYEIWTAPESMPLILQEMVAAGATPVGTTALNYVRIAQGIPKYGEDIRERDLPQETGQDRALHFTKGCYIGQEIVERIRSRGAVHRKFTGFQIEGPLPAPGAKINVAGKDVGEITSSAALPLKSGELKVALGYIRHEAVNKPVQIDDSKLGVASLPFAKVFEH